VQNLIQCNALRPAHPEEISAVGTVPGYASPIGIDGGAAIVVVDTLIVDTPNLVSGANESGYHLLNVNVPRDYEPDFVGSIASVHDGAPCIRCGHPLHLVRGVEVGNIFQLGTRYTAALNANFADEDGTERPIIMGSYGIGVGRLLACVAEEHRDERGLAWPISVAPFEVALVSLGRSEAALAQAETLYAELTKAGISVLYDERSASAGVKFADADLRGMPLRLTISDRSLAAGGVECRRRRGGEAHIVPLREIVTVLKSEIDNFWQELNASVQSVPTWETTKRKGERG
jgi:prolyl-tRNA synthetase